MRTRFRIASKEYVWMPVSEQTGKDISGDTVEARLTGSGVPTPWVTAAWKTVDGVLGAEVLIGPGSSIGQLAAGQYSVDLRVTDNPEVPVITAPNSITIY